MGSTGGEHGWGAWARSMCGEHRWGMQVGSTDGSMDEEHGWGAQVGSTDGEHGWEHGWGAWLGSHRFVMYLSLPHAKLLLRGALLCCRTYVNTYIRLVVNMLFIELPTYCPFSTK